MLATIAERRQRPRETIRGLLRSGHSGPVLSAGQSFELMNRHVKDEERWKKIVQSFSDVSVTVLADLVADEFVFGEIARVSREAPVLILKHRERTVVPGGGANAVMNLASLGVNVLPVGVVGDDEPGSLLLECLREKKVSTSGIQRLKGHTTTTKTRILAGMSHTSRQQVVRVDREPEPLDELHPILLNLVNAAREYATASDALLISDYGYGAATPRLLNFIKSNRCLENKPVTLDSRYRMLDFEGVTAATPNEPEVEEALGIRIGHDDQKLFAAGEQLMQRDATGVAGHHPRTRWHGGIRKRCEATARPHLRFRSGGGRNRRGRYRDCNIHRGAGRRRRYGCRYAAGELCRWRRGDEARHGHRLEQGIAGGHRPIFSDDISVNDSTQKILSRDALRKRVAEWRQSR